MSDNTDFALVALGKINPIELFTEGDHLDRLLKDIKRQATENPADIETDTGRKAVASVAYRVAQSKTMLDKAGKELVRDWKEKAKKVDNARKKTRDYLDELRDEVRKPLTDWQAAETAKGIKIIEDAKREQAWADAIAEDEIFNREKAIAEKEAAIAAKEEAALAAAAEAKRKQEQAEREEQIRTEAAAEAVRATEAKAQAELAAAEAKIVAEREAKEQAERDRIAAEERAKIEQELAVAQATEEAERRASEEQAAAEASATASKRAAERKAKNKQHMTKVNDEAEAGLVEEGVSAGLAVTVVALVAHGDIPHMSINYLEG